MKIQNRVLIRQILMVKVFIEANQEIIIKKTAKN
jgi:hypothetical protein